MPATPTAAPALSALQSFARRDLRAFAGLAEQTSLNDVAAVFDVDRSSHGQGLLGSARHQTNWFSAAAEGFARGIRVWAEGDVVVLIDATSINLLEPLSSLLGRLGEPEAKLNSFQGTFEVESNEYVYVRRGLTLYVDHAIDTPRRIAAFTPCGLESYQRDLRLDLRQKRLPPSRGPAQDDSP
ncbi:hypothetical protein ABIF90_008669 [Bradyrhizobium japonicum]